MIDWRGDGDDNAFRYSPTCTVMRPLYFWESPLLILYLRTRGGAFVSYSYSAELLTQHGAVHGNVVQLSLNCGDGRIGANFHAHSNILDLHC